VIFRCSGRAPSVRGFTLLELIVILFLVSLVATIVLPTFGGFGDRGVAGEAREIASILRYVHESAISRKETNRLTFDLDGQVVSWRTLEGERKKRFPSMKGVTIPSKGTVSRGGVTLFAEPLGFPEDVQVTLGKGDRQVTVVFRSLSGRTKIQEKG